MPHGTSPSPQKSRPAEVIQQMQSHSPFSLYKSPKLSIDFQRPEINPRGFGFRHVDDSAPFNLWDPANSDFRSMTEEENTWICQKYPGIHTISHSGPSLIISTSNPPNPVPITIAGVAAYFIAPDGEDGEAIFVNTRFASPRVPDPLPNLRVPRLTKVRPEEVELILSALSKIADIEALNFVDYYLYVELVPNQRHYDNHSLPGIVAGLSTTYHRTDDSLWGKQMDSARTRCIVPSAELVTQDVTNYSDMGPLCPGVRLSSSGSYSSTSLSTTAGVMLQNSLGQRRITVALAGFLESNAVFHPNDQGVRIGDIDERWNGLNIALTRPDPFLQFTNQEYFSANAPKKLLYSSQAPRGGWYEADGMSTGLVYFQLRGERFLVPLDLQGVPLTYRDLIEESIMYAHAPGGGNVMDGLCGAPIVSTDPDTAGVLGFFHLQAGKICLVAVLNELIDRGWQLV